MAFRNSPKYRIMTDTLNLMKAEGGKFPPVREAEAMFEADTAPQWAAGEVCHRCRVAFSTFTRQHHCRACGQVFCGKCSAKSCVLPKFGIEREVRVCDSCFDQYGPKEEEGGSPVHEKPAKTEKDGSDNLPAEYLASPLSKQPQEPQPKQGKSEAELKEEEELQLVLALSKSEADEKEAAKKKATSDLLAGYTNGITAPTPVKEENREERREIEQQPELEKYLDREYWEQQSRGTAKAAMAPQPLVERESGKEVKEEPAGEPEASGNSTSEEEGWLGAGRKSSKSVASSSFSNSVLGGAEKDSLSILENRILKGQEKRRRRSTAEQDENEEGREPRDFDVRQGEAGCALGPTVQVVTGVGRTDLSRTYCTGCSSHQGHNCSYTVPLSAHMPDPNISLLVPTSAVLLPGSLR